MANHKRKLRNYLLDPSLQLKFAFYAVAVALVVAGLVGTFLYRTTTALFLEMEAAVQARSQAAENSKELGNAALSAELLQHFEDPTFEKQLQSKSKEIDSKYEQEKQAIVAQRQDLVRRQRVFTFALIAALLGFAVLTGFASIVLTHRVAGPIFRVRRIVSEVAIGKFDPPTYALRDGDELKELFDDVSKMVTALKGRREETLSQARTLLSLAHEKNAPNDLREKLEELIRKLEPPAPAPPPGV
ncbi:MAG: signal protein [Myxococcaceae bacterium]